MKRKAAANGRASRAPASTKRHRKRPLTMGPPGGEPVTISATEAARHVDMSPRALMHWLEKLNAACLVRLSTRRRRIDRRGFFRLLERHGLGGPPHVG